MKFFEAEPPFHCFEKATFVSTFLAMKWFKIFLLISTLIVYLPVYGQNQDSLKIVALTEQNAEITRKLDSLLKINDLHELENKVDEIGAKNDGRFDSATWWFSIIFGVIFIIAVFNAFNTTRSAKNEARKAFKEDFDEYCKRIEEAAQKAERRLSEIESMQSTIELIKDKAVSSVEKITSSYPEKTVKYERSSKKQE